MAVMSAQQPSSSIPAPQVGSERSPSSSMVTSALPIVTSLEEPVDGNATLPMDIDSLPYSKTQETLEKAPVITGPALQPLIPNDLTAVRHDLTSQNLLAESKPVNAPPSPPVPTPPLQQPDEQVDDSTEVEAFPVNREEMSQLRIDSPPNISTVPPSIEANMSDIRSTDIHFGTPGNEPKVHSMSDIELFGHDGSEEAPDKVVRAADIFLKVPIESGDGSHDHDNVMAEDTFDESNAVNRAKTEVPEATSNATSAATSTGALTSASIPKHQIKFAISMIKQMKRAKYAAPFTVPVDPQALNIPKYFDVVKEPMDLTTLEENLASEKYATIAEFKADFDKIMVACTAFNGPEHIVTKMCKQLADNFERTMRNMPPRLLEVPASKAKPTKTVATPSVDGEDRKSTRARRHSNQPAAASPQSTQSPSQTFALGPSGLPQIRRDSVAQNGRPKRDIHPPPPRDLPYSKPRRKKNEADFKFADSLLKEMKMKRHGPIAHPFMQPVDPVALNIPHYFQIIKKPMDVSTIEKKLNENQYDNLKELEDDFRLMFANCYKFNPVGTPVYNLGKQYEAIFEQKWKERPAVVASPPSDESDESDASEEDADSSDDDTSVQKQLSALRNQLAQLENKSKKKTKKVKGEKGDRKVKEVGKGKKRKVDDEASGKANKKSKKKTVPYVTFEMKQELSERINTLTVEKIGEAMNILRANVPSLGGDTDEIELDIDELDNDTLYKLHQFVIKNAPPKYKPVTAPTGKQKKQTAAPPPKPKKNKPMSAFEQEQKIAELESALSNFQNPGGPHQLAGAEEMESSDDDDSASESEEE